ncbi:MULTISPECIES: methyltransferase domain-containing protein [Kribbella]|uniref:Protein-L-isoaspartate O-methyltransferase n=1 Tax=Kribbella pratensis TaxID=2512112 RepID=A0ABY2FJB8_9ACTN|nr:MULTISPECIES: methyltransferase domain-containing protein [Kribbella]TDW92166.1 protein-L-isoaspartate(D-aspartate) O-methyltransferase (PCMT) [Kribbella sp. VKM Ac-2566]TDW92889.1 protein-L-isoaspartate(D-aspartate) O-methyltransferase (PCMT) [Kribbella pratensis]
MTDWTDAARKLADEITAAAPEWHDSVSSTPRHQLVPRWWEPIPDSYPFAWGLRTPHPDQPWAEIYADETLVTRVGALHADRADLSDRPTGLPTSSSTLPGLIVRMLHLLSPGEQDRVLDVGTGSGYSAALLARRLGDKQVTSIDVDPYLVDAARERLAAFGRTPHLEIADATGSLPDANYDRIIATVSVRPIPPAWLDALRPGGKIVTTITGTSLLINAKKHPDGVVRGRVQPDPATFMRTRRDTDYPARLDHVYDDARDQPGTETRQLSGPLPDLWDDWELRCLYELDSPDIENRSATREDGSQLLWLLAADGSWARADSEDKTVHQSGPRRLWDDLERVQAKWAAAGHFPLHTMTVELDTDRNTLTSPDSNWTLDL